MTAIPTAAPANGQPSGLTAGEALPLDALYRAFGADVEAFCTRRLGPDDGQDAAHEVLLRAAKSTWRGEASVRWWLGTIARNVCSDYARRRSRELPVGLPTDTRHGAADDSNGRSAAGLLERVDPDTVEDVAEERARADLVQHALAALSDRDRRYLGRFHFDGLTYADMARLDHITSRAAHGRLLRARKRLRNAVEAVADRNRLWPLPALVPYIPRLRARWTALRARATHAFLDHAASPTAPLGSILSHSAVHVTAAVVGTVSLSLAGGDAAVETPADHTDPRAPIAIAHEASEQRPEPSGEVPAASTSYVQPSNAPEVRPTDTGNVVADRSEGEQTDQTPLPQPPNPTVESNAEAVVSEPVEHRDSSHDDPGYEPTLPTMSVDRDGDGEPEHEDTWNGGGLSCGNPEQHGTVTSTLCATSETLSEDPAGI